MSDTNYRSHFLPRTTWGWAIAIVTVGSIVLANWPVMAIFNKPVQSLFGLPLLYVWLQGLWLVWMTVGTIAHFMQEKYEDEQQHGRISNFNSEEV